MKRKEGISLIVLVLTIVVIVILATAVILSIANNNPIENAKKAKFLNDIKTIEEDLNMYALSKKLDNYSYDISNINLSGDEMVKELPSSEKYVDKIKIVKGEIVLKATATEEEIEWAKELGIGLEKPSYLKESSSDESTFLGIGGRTEITKVIFENATKDAPLNVVDVSGDNSIIGWLDGTEAHIASDGIICAPENSSFMFTNMENLIEIENLILLDTSNVTNMADMFSYCEALTSLDVSCFDTSNVGDMQFMFYYCELLTSLDISDFDTSNVTNMSGMFGGCKVLTSLDLSNFDTSNVTDISAMFEECSGLTNLNVNNFNTSNVTNMSNIFNGCSGLTNLNVNNFNTSNVTNMSNIFNGCSGLTNLNVSNFNTSNVTNMRWMFNECSGLTKLDVSNFDTSNVNNMEEMFWSCKNLTSLDVSNFNTLNVTDMYGMFGWCETLTSLDLSNFDTSNVNRMIFMFSNCSSLETIYASDKFNTDKVLNSGGMFIGCESIIGGNGTIYDSNYCDNTYARIDGGTGNPGYFTLKNK